MILKTRLFLISFGAVRESYGGISKLLTASIDHPFFFLILRLEVPNPNLSACGMELISIYPPPQQGHVSHSCMLHSDLRHFFFWNVGFIDFPCIQ